jgi:hypothetical protein
MVALSKEISAGLWPERIGRFVERSEYEADRSDPNPARQTPPSLK